MNRLARIVVVLALLFAVSGCSGGGPGADEALRDLGFTVFAPELDGAGPTETRIINADQVVSQYPRYASLVQTAVPDGDLCDAVLVSREAGVECRVTDGVVHTSRDENAGVGIVRNGTFMMWYTLIIEGPEAPGLLDRAEQSLRDAPESDGDDLGTISTDENADGKGPGSSIGSEPSPPEPTTAAATPQVSANDFDTWAAMAVVRHLAGTIGPREATSPAFERAARWVGRRFDRLDYSVRRQPIAVPAGNSWGVPVNAGRSVNVIATPPDFLPEEPHLIVGAHLDTVAQAPGAEDNASGIGVMLTAAELAAAYRTRLPVVFVAFGAEEPRGPTDADHHFGSRTYVEAMAPGERDAVRGMISLDRVGVGARVPVGSANDTDPVQRQLLAAARRAGVPTTPDPDQRSSDHWSFVRAGMPGARLGSTSYVEYHSAQDVVSVVEPAQIERVGRLVLGWLSDR